MAGGFNLTGVLGGILTPGTLFIMVYLGASLAILSRIKLTLNQDVFDKWNNKQPYKVIRILGGINIYTIQ